MKVARDKASRFARKNIGKLIAAGLLAASLSACSGKTADEHIQQAQVFLEQGDTAAAIVELKSAVQQNPRMAQARYELGKVYIAQKDFESAEKELSRALELGHPPGEVIPFLSEAYQRTGSNVALAQLEVDEENLTSVERLEVGYRKLQSLIRLEKNGEARVLIDELSSIDSSSVYKGLIETHRDILDRDYDDALEKAILLQERAPLNRDVLAFTARLHMLNGQQEEAAAIYEEYVGVATEDLESKFALANMLVEQGKLENAEVYVDELMQVSDTNPLLNQLKGIIRAADEDYENALSFSEKAIQFGATDPRVRLVSGFAAYQLGEFEKAVMHLGEVASFLPDGHPGLRILAASQLQSDMGTDASEVLTRIGDIGASDASLFSRAGYELIQEGNLEEAKKVIEQAEKISETADDLTRLGILKLSVNNVEGLINLQQAVNKAPESVTARTTLASAYLGTNQLERAMNLAKDWQAESPTAPEGYVLESEVLQRQENFDEALAVLNKAKEFAADSPPILVSSIRLQLRQGNTDDALVNTEKLLEVDPSNNVGLASFYAIKAEQGQAAEGLARLQTAFQADTSNQALALITGRAALASGQIAASLEALETIEPDRAAPNQYWMLKGTALLRANQMDAAEKHYQQWAEFFPKQENAALGQLLIMDVKRDYEKGLDIAIDFLRGKDNLQVKFLQSYFYIMTGDAENAQATLDSIEEQYKPLPFLRGVQARVLLAQGRADEAVDDALVSYEQNTRTDNLFVAVQALQLSGQEQASFELLQKHTEQFPRDVRAKMVLAERMISRDTPSAIGMYKEMLELTPNNFVVLNNLAYLQMEAGNLEEAAGYAERAFEIQPDNIATADTYAQVLVRQGNIEEAMEAYNNIMSDDIENEEIILNYIEVLLKNGSPVAASRRLEERQFTLDVSKERIEALKREYDL
ncbi:XrtA/PEP-CTERM system TPR-repeat protein PrsT [Ningiella sp. W23]|uniref:XrtA/PEP-CTERM system TPR-repeat protein PrsT n=1 Tax=Ningiella sp. W23 TaxID=3023715 RepID=UPI00375802AA